MVWQVALVVGNVPIDLSRGPEGPEHLLYAAAAGITVAGQVGASEIVKLTDLQADGDHLIDLLIEALPGCGQRVRHFALNAVPAISLYKHPKLASRINARYLG